VLRQSSSGVHQLGRCDGHADLIGEANITDIPHLGIDIAGWRSGNDITGARPLVPSWMYNEFGTVDTPVVPDDTAGDSHTCIVHDENRNDDIGGGAVRCFGDNDNYQIGSASTSNHSFSEWVNTPYPGISVDPDSQTRDDWQTRFAFSGPIGRFTDIDAGGDVTCGLRTTSVHFTQPPTGVTSTTAGLVCWGKPYVDTDPRSTTVITTDVNWSEISVGPNSACALKASGALFCWGANDVGQLGLGANTLASGNVYGQHRPYPSNA
jgi:hypothetical protein